jgi:hypothetical protein
MPLQTLLCATATKDALHNRELCITTQSRHWCFAVQRPQSIGQRTLSDALSDKYCPRNSHVGLTARTTEINPSPA